MLKGSCSFNSYWSSANFSIKGHVFNVSSFADHLRCNQSTRGLQNSHRWYVNGVAVPTAQQNFTWIHADASWPACQSSVPWQAERLTDSYSLTSPFSNCLHSNNLRVSLNFGEGNGNPIQYPCLRNPKGQRSQAGYCPCGHQRGGHDFATKQQKQIFPEHSDYQKCYHLPAWQTFILLTTCYMSGTGLSPGIKKTIIFAPTLEAFAVSFLNMHKCIIWLLWCIHIFQHYSKNSVISET